MSNKYKIELKQDEKTIYEVEAERLCQVVKKFIGHCLTNRWIKDISLIGYLMRHRIISRARLMGMCFVWGNDDINKQELIDAKKELNILKKKLKE